MLKSGDVFKVTLSPSEPKPHFWVIVLAITETKDLILANITSYCVDKTLAIFSAEYEILTQNISYVNYPGCRIEKEDTINEKITNKYARICPPVPKELLKQIQEGALRSKYTPNNIKILIKKCLKQKLS